MCLYQHVQQKSLLQHDEIKRIHKKKKTLSKIVFAFWAQKKSGKNENMLNNCTLREDDQSEPEKLTLSEVECDVFTVFQ